MNRINKDGIKKIGVISDTHVPTRAKYLPNIMHEHFKGVDFIIHCGDIVDNSVIIELETIAPVYAVKGNMDPHVIDFEPEMTIKVNNKYVLCVSHGHGSPFTLKDKLYKTFSNEKPDMILFGHAHKAYDETYKGIHFFNPGSATSGTEGNSIGIINVTENGLFGSIIGV
jgi:putative phosphoesterase